MDELSIDVWANIAKFMSQSDRILAYYSLKELHMIPMYRSEHETMMRFLEVGAEFDKSKEIQSITVHDVVNKLVGMGFEKHDVMYTLDLFGDRVYWDVDFLVDYMLKLQA